MEQWPHFANAVAIRPDEKDRLPSAEKRSEIRRAKTRQCLNPVGPPSLQLPMLQTSRANNGARDMPATRAPATKAGQEVSTGRAETGSSRLAPAGGVAGAARPPRQLPAAVRHR